jgi:hypothetical protein
MVTTDSNHQLEVCKEPLLADSHGLAWSIVTIVVCSTHLNAI